jgi:hypothetical protein
VAFCEICKFCKAGRDGNDSAKKKPRLMLPGDRELARRRMSHRATIDFDMVPSPVGSFICVICITECRRFPKQAAGLHTA